jgi:Flp pilus assembly protein TadB
MDGRNEGSSKVQVMSAIARFSAAMIAEFPAHATSESMQMIDREIVRLTHLQE